MKAKLFLLSGLAIPAVFTGAIFGLALLTDDYNHASQTVSEIGKQGSQAELLWKIANLLVATLIFIMAWGLFCVSRLKIISAIPAYFLGYFAVAFSGLAAFESPHPLHNFFGLCMIPGYMAPFALAISWRKVEGVMPLRKASWIVGILILISIGLNLSPLYNRDLYPVEYYGLVQRSLLILFYGIWCPVVAMYLYKLQNSLHTNK